MRGGGRDGRPRVLAVLGTRPEAVKMAPVISALRSRADAVAVGVVHTGQHEDLAAPFLELLEIRPDRELGLMTEGQGVHQVVARGVPALREVLVEERPRMVLVQGDTATVFLAAFASFLERIAVGHVEAGLRSGNKWAPFPEEVFRRLTGVIGDHHFAPTRRARENLLREGVDPSTVHVTGNPVVDTLQRTAHRVDAPRDSRVAAVLSGDDPVVLLTAHRRESFGPPLERIFRAVRTLAGEAPVQVVYPVHPNPEVRRTATRLLRDRARIHLVDPLDYLDLVAVLRDADLVLTDSGGIQEEAPTFGVPVLVLREVTERPEGIEAGVARLVGADPDTILDACRELLPPGATARRRRRDRETSAGPWGRAGNGVGAVNPYGDGRAGERIAGWVLHHLAGEDPPEEWEGP